MGEGSFPVSPTEATHGHRQLRHEDDRRRLVQPQRQGHVADPVVQQSEPAFVPFDFGDDPVQLLLDLQRILDLVGFLEQRQQPGAQRFQVVQADFRVDDGVGDVGSDNAAAADCAECLDFPQDFIGLLDRDAQNAAVVAGFLHVSAGRLDQLLRFPEHVGQVVDLQ